MGSLCACVDPRHRSPAAKPTPPPSSSSSHPNPPPSLPSFLPPHHLFIPPTPPAYMRAPLLFLDSSVGLSPAVTNLRNQTEFDCIESGEYWPSLHVSWVERHFFGEGKAEKKKREKEEAEMSRFTTRLTSRRTRAEVQHVNNVQSKRWKKTNANG